MTPHTSGLYKTLHLLVMLWRSNRQRIPKLELAEQAVLKINRQVLRDAGLTVPELANYLTWLAERHYAEGIVIFHDKYRERVKKEMDGDAGKRITVALQTLDKEAGDGKAKQMVIEHIKSKLPHHMELDEEEVEADGVSMSDLSGEGYKLFKRLQPDEISLVVLFPFRSVERLLERIGDGEKPSEIKDEGTHYDHEKHIFYIGEEPIPVSHQGKENIEHHVLIHFEQAKKTGKIWFDDIDGFRPNSLKRAMYRFLEKDKRLEALFSVHRDRIEVFTGRIY